MLGVLIVDDEAIVRYGIKSMIDWEKLGLTVVGDASNGKEALELFNTFKPQIVITDIKMPVMDGIELIKHIREIDTEVKIIILSCLQDFAYAREAIRLGTAEYLVKSDMMPSDMENVLLQVKETISIEQEKLHQIDAIRQKAHRTQLIEKEKFLWDLSQGAVSNNQYIIDTISQLNLEYLKGNVFVLFISMDYYEKTISGLSEQEKKVFDFSFLEIVKRELERAERIKGEVFGGNNGEINLIIKVLECSREKEVFDCVNALGERVIKSVKAQNGHSISIGISNRVEDLMNIKDAYFRAQLACKFKTFFGCGRVIHYASTQRPKTLDSQIRVNIRELQDYVYFIQREKVTYFIEEIFGRLAEHMDFEGVNLISLELVLVLSSMYSEIRNNNNDVMAKKKEYYDQIKYLETINDIKNWFKASFGELLDVMGSVYNSDKNVIAKAINYIHANYSHEITLQTISEHVHLSKNYFVNLFKRETDESFIEYLTRTRIENAKILIKNSSLKTSDIGSKVGIEDSRYFSKVFKKITGLTPSEYKELNR